MKPSKALQIELDQLIARWGIDVTLQITRRTEGRLGRYDHNRRHIQIARWLLKDENERSNTLRHEYAHAMTMTLHGYEREGVSAHGDEWAAWAVLLGARPEATIELTPVQRKMKNPLTAWLYSDEEIIVPVTRWRHTVSRFIYQTVTGKEYGGDCG